MRVRVFLIASVCSVAVLVSAQQKPLLSKRGPAIQRQLRGLRSLPDDTRGVITKQLAIEIRRLASGANKLMLAMEDTLVWSTWEQQADGRPVGFAPARSLYSRIRFASLAELDALSSGLEQLHISVEGAYLRPSTGSTSLGL